MFKLFWSLLLILSLTWGCASASPPKEFAPDGKLVERAIAVQLQQAQQGLSEQLSTNLPNWKIDKVTVKKLEPIYIGKLPTYHLQGTYRLNLKLSQGEQKNQENDFEIYLQRQIEGKTWRLLKYLVDTQQWFSYSLDNY